MPTPNQKVHGRNAEHPGIVVKIEAAIVVREELRGLELGTQELVHSVVVLRAVQPVKHGCPGSSAEFGVTDLPTQEPRRSAARERAD